MINPQPKKRPIRDKKYLAFIRTKPCIICGNKSVAAHVRKQYWGASTAQKPHDYVCVPLCDGLGSLNHHQVLDSVGMEKFEIMFNVDVKRTIIGLLIEYFGRKCSILLKRNKKTTAQSPSQKGKHEV